MDVMVVGDFTVKAGHEAEFERAFTSRSGTSEHRPAVKEVCFGRSMSEGSRYRRVGIWPSQQDWQDFQGTEQQRRFWSEMGEHLSEDPSFEFYDLLP